MELGGNIELHGFVEEQEADLIIIKKIVGRFTKRISEHHTDFEGLRITFDEQPSGARVEGQLKLDSDVLEAEDSSSNTYLSLDAVLKGLKDQAAARAA